MEKIYNIITNYIKFNCNKKSRESQLIKNEKVEIIKELEVIKSKITFVESHNKRIGKNEIIISVIIGLLALAYYFLGIHQEGCISYEIKKEIVGIVGFGLVIFMATDNNTRYHANKELIFNMKIQFIELARPLYVSLDLPLELRKYYESILLIDDNERREK